MAIKESGKPRPLPNAGRRNDDLAGAFLREAASEISQGLMVIDADLNIVFVNEPYRVFFGLTHASPFAQDGAPVEPLLRELAKGGEYGPGDIDAHIEARLGPVRKRQVFNMDRRMKSGKYVQITGNPLESGAYVFTFTDVTQRVEQAARLDEQVRERTRELHSANEKLVDGIHYARMIQGGIMPNAAFLERHLGEYCLHYRPADILGGDFYLGVRTEYGLYIGLGDCTGHGVPGAMMTMLATTVCHRAINEVGREGPAAAIQAVDHMVRSNLHQSAGEFGPDNGLDLALCLIDPDSRTLRYAGAGIDLFSLKGGQATRHRSARQGLGYQRRSKGAAMPEISLTATDADRIFLTTDGLLDQSGGQKGFGFGARRLLDALQQSADLPLQAQGQFILDKLERHREGHTQRDDMAFLGFSVPN